MSPETLLKGAVYALEQCGLLLRDANILYRNRSYASAVVLTAFAREELGRYRILLEFWHRARDCKETFTADQIRNACDDHVTKQQAGMFSSTMRADRDSGLGKVLRASMENPPTRTLGLWHLGFCRIRIARLRPSAQNPTKRLRPPSRRMPPGPCFNCGEA